MNKAVNLYELMKSKFFIVEPKPVFDTERKYYPVMKCDIASARIRNIDISEDGETITLNHNNVAKIAGKINYKIEQVIFDKEIAYEVMGAYIEKNIKIAEENLLIAQEEVKTMKNLAKFHEDEMAADKLAFNKAGKNKELKIEK
jgi:hypothetical protein